MKVVCINNNGTGCGLCVGKIYTTISENKTCYIINDMGLEIPYLKERFRTLSKVREKKLNKIFEK